MNFGEMFSMLDNSPSYQQQAQQSVDTYGYDPFTQPPEPQYQDQPSMTWEEAFSNFKTTPVLYNMDGFTTEHVRAVLVITKRHLAGADRS